MKPDLRRLLLDSREKDYFWTGRLSDSAVSTAVACVALETADAEKYADAVRAGKNWLLNHQNADGLYGDSPESPANLTATFMSYVALSRNDSGAGKLAKAQEYLLNCCGDFSFSAIRKGFLHAYGKDLTFSVPILAMATAAGFFADTEAGWQRMPKFPFEAVILPEQLFHCLHLPVVSYAIPALICVGLAQNKHARSGMMKGIRASVAKRALRILERKQPSSGGFLEAAPLTAFCALCLGVAGLSQHPVTQNALRFLTATQRENGAWSIDHDLRQWVTALSLPVVADMLPDREKTLYRARLKAQQTTTVHPFTRSAPGGWGWTTRSGGVPDADDTSAALVALHALGEDASPSVGNGIDWLLNLQNRDGGIPTFCRGWGKFPFDRSCPDISAHAYKAFSCYEKQLPYAWQIKVKAAMTRILAYLQREQRPDGSFIPLWFGDQYAKDKIAPVYGTAVVLEHLYGGDDAAEMLERAKDFLLKSQHKSGGWGSYDSEHDYVIFTARCVKALQPFEEAKPAITRAMKFLKPYFDRPETIPPEPIGLYFAHLWYDEKFYAPIFLAACGETS
ncbi:MAG: prenyltransferase/squalene oxidase repeat-containing protein [Victivallales bacterium]|nr:prenyltransferase/squalene oxidase repeat-containing protein [Victivallales bacterium]